MARPHKPGSGFIAEQSFLKSAEAAKIEYHDEARYGQRNTIRFDILEQVGTQTVCVYDVKTAASGLSPARMEEIAAAVARNYGGWRKIIVTEIRTPRRAASPTPAASPGLISRSGLIWA